MAARYDLDKAIRKVPGFPKPGVLFYDITSILTEPGALRLCVDRAADRAREARADGIAAIESRGFLFAAPFAQRLGLPLILVRKKGKLPGRTVSKSYALEYGQAEIEIHAEDIPAGGRVLIVDDLVATGGTLRAAADLLSESGARPIGVFCVIGLPFLHYDRILEGLPVKTLIEYFGE